MTVGGLHVRKRDHEARLVRILPHDLDLTPLFFQVGDGRAVLRLEVGRGVYLLGRREGWPEDRVGLAATKRQERREHWEYEESVHWRTSRCRDPFSRGRQGERGAP